MTIIYTFECTHCKHKEASSEAESYKTKGIKACPSCGKKMTATMTFDVRR